MLNYGQGIFEGLKAAVSVAVGLRGSDLRGLPNQEGSDRAVPAREERPAHLG